MGGQDIPVLHLAQEIREQPEALARLLDRQARNIQEIATQIGRREISHVIIAARGTSNNAGVYGRYALESLAGLVGSLAAPSLFTLYKRPPRLDKALVVGISQSGQGTDIIQVLSEANAQGALTLALTNYASSPMAEIADLLIPLEAGEEQSVAATKTYTAELLALAALSAALGGEASRRDELQRIPDVVGRVLRMEERIQTAVERYRYMQGCVVLGRGYNYATALEIALKLKETCYLATQPYSTADFRHGPIAMISPGFSALVIGPKGAVFEDVFDCAQELLEKQAELIVLSDQDNLLGLARTPLAMPDGIPEWLTPIPYVVPGQLFALYLSLSRGYNPDQPRGLRKVTRTT